MKKIITIILCISLLSVIFATVCYASDEAINEEGNISESEVAEDEAATEAPTNLFTRVYEFVENNIESILTTAFSLIIIIFNILSRKNALSLGTKQDNTIGGVNSLIEGYDVIFKNFDETKLACADLARSVTSAIESIKELQNQDVTSRQKLEQMSEIIENLIEKEIAQNTALMDVLNSVYGNSKLPQGVKDFVALKRTESMQLANEAVSLVHPKCEEVGTDET